MRQLAEHFWKERLTLALLLSVLLCFTFNSSFAAVIPAESRDTEINVFDKAQVATGFSCNADGSTNGAFYINNRTCKEPGHFAVFGNMVCTFENVISESFGKIFCGMQKIYVPVMGAVITLFVVITGILFVTGILPFRTKEAMTALMKMALVFGFATQSDLLVGIAYKFFISVSQEGITIVLAGLFPGENLSGGDVFENSDKMFAAFGDKSAFDTITLTALLGIMVPPLGAGVVKAAMTSMAFVIRGILGYLLALIGITFMMILAPIFLSFALYKSTYSYFDTWTKYLASFSLQMMIIFSFTTLTKVIDYSGFRQSMKELIKEYPSHFKMGSITIPMTGKSICKFEEVVRVPKKPMPNPSDPSDKNNYTTKSIKDYNAGVDELGKIVLQCKDPVEIIPFTQLIFSQAGGTGYLTYLLTICVSVIAVCYAGDQVLRGVPEMAKQLAGVNTAGRLGGITPSDVVFAQKQFHMVGSEALASGAAGAEHGYTNTQADGLLGMITRGPKSIMNAAGEGSDSFLYGTKDEKGNTTSRGLYQEFTQEAAGLGRAPKRIEQANNPGFFQANSEADDSGWLGYMQMPGRSKTLRQMSEEEQFQEQWDHGGPQGLLPSWMR